jgi:hypothetical protein
MKTNYLVLMSFLFIIGCGQNYSNEKKVLTYEFSYNNTLVQCSVKTSSVYSCGYRLNCEDGDSYRCVTNVKEIYK